jgi:hypothetical protein
MVRMHPPMRWFSQVRRLGVAEGMDARAAERLVLANEMAVTIFLIALPVFFVLRAAGMAGFADFGMAMGFGYLAIPLLNALGRTVASRILHVTYACGLATLASYHFGRDSGFYFHFFSVLTIALLVTGRDEKKLLIPFLALIGVAVTGLAAADYFGPERHADGPRVEKSLFLFNLMSSLLLNTIRIAGFFRDAGKAESPPAEAGAAARGPAAPPVTYKHLTQPNTQKVYI